MRPGVHRILNVVVGVTECASGAAFESMICKDGLGKSVNNRRRTTGEFSSQAIKCVRVCMLQKELV